MIRFDECSFFGGYFLTEVFGSLMLGQSEPSRDDRRRYQQDRRRDDGASQGRFALTPARQTLPPRDAAGMDRLAGEKSAQVLGQARGARVAFARFFLQTLEADGFQVVIDTGVQVAGRHGLALEDLLKRLQSADALKGRPGR